MLTLGIDSGTSSTKTIVLDTVRGTVLAQAHAPHETIAGLPHGHVEQDPQIWWRAADATVRDCLAQIGAKRSEIRAIGVSGQQHGLVVLDEKGAVVRPAKLWCDTSTAAEADDLNAMFGGAERMIELTGNAMSPGFTAPKLLWLKRHEPENFRRARSVLLPHDYLNFWLTGEQRMEFGDASGTGLMDVRARTWFAPLLEKIDDELASKLPRIASSREAMGTLGKARMEEWGLTGTVTVSAGGGDNMMGAIGTGNVTAGKVTVSLGTSGTIYAYAAQPVIDARGEIAAFCDSTDAWLPLACTMNVGGALQQTCDLFGDDFPAFENKLAGVAPGAGGVLFLPYLQGERTPNLPSGSGVFHGLNYENMTSANLVRAVVEGVLLGLAYGMRRFENLGVVPKEIRLTGGGSKSPTICQMAADIFGAPIRTLLSAEAAATGAAIQAAWTSPQGQTSTAALDGWTDINVKLGPSRYDPRPEAAEIYRECAERHTRLTRVLKEGGFL